MAAYGQQMRAKLGFTEKTDQDNDLLTELLSLMIKEGRDYTRTFRLLSEVEVNSAQSPLRDDFVDRDSFDSWYNRYRSRLKQESVEDAQRQLLIIYCVTIWPSTRLSTRKKRIYSHCSVCIRRCSNPSLISLNLMTLLLYRPIGESIWKSRAQANVR